MCDGATCMCLLIQFLWCSCERAGAMSDNFWMCLCARIWWEVLWIRWVRMSVGGMTFSGNGYGKLGTSVWCTRSCTVGLSAGLILPKTPFHQCLFSWYHVPIYHGKAEVSWSAWKSKSTSLQSLDFQPPALSLKAQVSASGIHCQWKQHCKAVQVKYGETRKLPNFVILNRIHLSVWSGRLNAECWQCTAAANGCFDDTQAQTCMETASEVKYQHM